MTSPDPYSALVRASFADPVHAGSLDDGISVLVEDQGVRVRLAAATAAGKASALRFLAWGCPHFIAACEQFCATHEGRPLAGLASYESADIMRKLSVPVEKTGRILVLEDAVRALGRALLDDAAPV